MRTNNLIRILLDTGRSEHHARARPHLTATVELDELPGATPERAIDIRREARTNGYLSPATWNDSPATATSSRVITTGRSEILDIGRATRTIPPPLWKALVKRDRTAKPPAATNRPNAAKATTSGTGTKAALPTSPILKLYCWHHHREEHKHDPQPRARDG